MKALQRVKEFLSQRTAKNWIRWILGIPLRKYVIGRFPRQTPDGLVRRSLKGIVAWESDTRYSFLFVERQWGVVYSETRVTIDKNDCDGFAKIFV